jgi:mannosyltransferase
LLSARSYPKDAPRIGRDTGFLVAAGAIVLVGAGLRLKGIAEEGPWADELWTLLITDPALSFAEFWRRVVADTHPPLYYLMMRGWSAMFGQSDFAARLPSAICGTLMVAAGAMTALPRPGRLALMALLAISPGAVEYAQEARSYALLLLWSTVVAGACIGIVTKSRQGRAGGGALTLLTIAGILAAYTHYFGALLAIAAGVVALALCRNWRAGLPVAIISAGFAPWVIYHAHHMSSGVELVAWMADFPLAATADWFLRLWLGDSAPLLALEVFAATFLLIPRLRRAAQGDAALLVGVVLAVLTAAAAVIISWRMPILSARNLVVVIPALYLAIAALAADAIRVSATAGTAGIATLLVLILPNLDWYGLERTKEQWRESAAFVLARPGCAKGPIHVYGDRTIYKYLIGKARPELELREIPWGKVAETQWQPAADCPVELWAGKISPDDFAQLLSDLPPLKPGCRQVAEFYWAYVVTRDPGDPACAQKS